MTRARLVEVGELFAIPSQPKLPKPVGNSVDSSQELHNQLKGRRKKSRADLGDVEVILELLPEMPQQVQ